MLVYFLMLVHLFDVGLLHLSLMLVYFFRCWCICRGVAALVLNAGAFFPMLVHLFSMVGGQHSLWQPTNSFAVCDGRPTLSSYVATDQLFPGGGQKCLT